ncbi:MAG TPA: type II and III secretion system protein family protein [Gemmatimonadales bacterium]|nr:type II and III secretion system protein family protein [Gemmatimonadales bacterium]
MRFLRRGSADPFNQAGRWCFACALLLCELLVVVVPCQAQRVVRSPEQVVSVSKGASALLVNTTPIQRFSIGDPAVAEAVVVSPTEILINGKTLGTTSLFLWDNTGTIKLYSVEVTADAPGLQRYLSSVLPGERIDVVASGNVVTLSGQVHDASVASRAVEIAKGSGATIVDNLTTPEAIQVLLKVRFAEVNKSVIKEFRSQLAILNPQDLNSNGDWIGTANTLPQTGGFSDGVVDLGLFNANASIELLIRALTSKGLLKSLAEPNLIALPGTEATFLAGGEFPYPSVQGGGGNNAVAIVFKEFGIRLKFTPSITRNGSIRLKVAPEVSALDFSNPLVFGGFTIPSLISRKTETEVEMRNGQYLAIAGLVDNRMTNNTTKIPFLGDIPILGQFFRSKDARQNRSELLVLVSPKLVLPSDTPALLPTGEPTDWKWSGQMKLSSPSDTSWGKAYQERQEH